MKLATLSNARKVTNAFSSLVEKAGGSDLASIEKYFLSMPCVEGQIKLTHTFAPGLYLRELRLEAGAFALGHEHLTEHVCMLLEGEISLFNENGSITTLRAPALVNAKKGRKLCYAVTAVTWLNLHPTTETDLDVLESIFIRKSSAFLELENTKVKELPWLG
jgi:hypothetical protein